MNMADELHRTLEGLLQQRDELRVQLHLAKLEARQEWDRAEAGLDDFRHRLDGATREARDASDEIWAGVRTVGEEIKDAYERIRNSLKA